MSNRLYILIRTDLPSMTTGRAMAQASHASNAFIHKYGKRKEVQEWQKETKQGFGTAIVLAASLGEINDVFLQLNALFPNGIQDYVIDPEYGIKTNKEMFDLINPKKVQFTKTIINDDGSVILFKDEITCAYVFGDKDELNDIIGDLPLHP